MPFEKKDARPKEEPKKAPFYKGLKLYWLIVPFLFLSWIYLSSMSRGAEEVLDSGTLITLASQALNIILAGMLHFLSPKERSKKGIADIFLKITMGQQLVMRNPLGIVLAFAAWRELPQAMDPSVEESLSSKAFYLNKQWILVLLGIISVLSLIIAYGSWQLS